MNQFQPVMNTEPRSFCLLSGGFFRGGGESILGACLLICLSLSFSVNGAAVNRSSDADLLARGKQIDAFITERLQREDVQPLRPAEETVLLRRLYLDLVGRIPTADEAGQYLTATNPGKLGRLIKDLLDSEGHVSHEFNLWADLLRVQSRMRNLPGHPYVEWIQESFRWNMPYDEFVSNLITAEGYLWDDGATGFYFRDAGMELDHMANTFQVFLGTQVVCAQCHDHPYDSWTQKQYYEQAAYIYGVKTSDPKAGRKFRELGNNKAREDIDPELKVAARRMVRPLRSRVFESRTPLKFPHDYQYDDAEPKSAVSPHPMFGDVKRSHIEGSLRHQYAAWMTDPENPRFATVVANRYWKRLMGVGLIEPVDDLKDSVEASHPELLKFLADTLVEIGFDLRKFQAILCQTETYQRATLNRELDPDAPFLFEGRPLERMRAEQMWDSVMALIVPDLDERPGTVRTDRNFVLARQMQDKSLDEILAIVEKEDALEKSIRSTQNKMNQMQRRLRNLQRQKRKDQADELQDKLKDMREQIASYRAESMVSFDRERDKEQDRWNGLPGQLVRASAVQSPAPEGHFLREFGQSDRETIDASSDEASVPQALMLLNGPVMDYLKNGRAELASALKQAETPDAKLDVLFMGFLTRKPSVEEKEWLLSEWNQHGNEAVEKIAWMLLNAREFSFIQ